MHICNLRLYINELSDSPLDPPNLECPGHRSTPPHSTHAAALCERVAAICNRFKPQHATHLALHAPGVLQLDVPAWINFLDVSMKARATVTAAAPLCLGGNIKGRC